MWLGIALAVIFGPFGLIYASWIGAAVLTGLTVLAGYIRGGSWAALDRDSIMVPIWRLAVIASVVWMFVAIHAHNSRLRRPPGG
jgi:membrane protein DedA with SNARE-associated domain